MSFFKERHIPIPPRPVDDTPNGVWLEAARKNEDRGANGVYTALSPDGRLALRTTSSGTDLKIIQLDDGSETLITKDVRYTSWVHVSADGVGLLVDDRTIRIVDMATGKMRTLRVKNAKRAWLVQPGVLAVWMNAAVEFLDATTGKQIAKPLPTKVDEMMVSPRGVIATASWNEKTSVTLWADRDHPVAIPMSPSTLGLSSAQHLSFSPDGSRLGFFEDNLMRIVDVDKGEQIVEGTPEPHIKSFIKFLGWTLLSKDSALVGSTGQHGDASTRVAVLSTVALTAEATVTRQLVVKGIDGLPFIGPDRVFVNRGLVLERTDTTQAKPVVGPPVVWVESLPAASKKATTKKATKPKLHLSAAALSALKDLGAALEVLSAHVDLSAFAPGSSLADQPLAEAAAKPLEGEVLSSDIDCELFPCVLEGNDPRGENVTVVKPTKKLGTDRLLSDKPLDADVSPEEQEVYEEAAKILESTSPVRQLRITDDNEITTVVLTLGSTATGSPGLLTVRVDT